MVKRTTYADAGVNIELGDDASKVLYEAAKLTWQNRKGKLGEVVEIFKDFSGLRAINVGGLPKDTYMNLSFDGVGTKVEIAERVGKHDTVAYDLFAMVCDDAVVRGAEPVLVGSILDVNTLGNKDKSYIDFVKQLAKGYINAAKDANVAIVNGEVAELGARVKGYGDFNYNWGAGVVWFAHKSRMFTGHEIKEGDYLVGLAENGFRSNGISLVRKILAKAHSEYWHELEKNIAEETLTPSTIYSKAVVEMFGGYNLDRKPRAIVHGIAHITGGGIPGKLGRVLKPSGLGAKIDNPLTPCGLMNYCQHKGNVSDEEAYKTWNMGHGMIIITPTPEDVMLVSHKYHIDSKIIGEVDLERGIKIESKGYYSHDKILSF
jgi:phosphoribosylformylglycinamidine cyclo-ligase